MTPGPYETAHQKKTYDELVMSNGTPQNTEFVPVYKGTELAAYGLVVLIWKGNHVRYILPDGTDVKPLGGCSFY